LCSFVPSFESFVVIYFKNYLDGVGSIIVNCISLYTLPKFEEQMDEIATKKDLFQVKAELEITIEKVRADMIKWMFIFWVGQVSVTVGLILLFIK